jgi:hypothetical protein
VYQGKEHNGSIDITGSSAANMSPAECYRLSSAHDFFGVVNGNRCIAFKTLRDAAVAGAQAGACSVPCTGAGSTKCGGKEAMQLYARNKPLPQLAPVNGERGSRGGSARGREGRKVGKEGRKVGGSAGLCFAVFGPTNN